MRELLLVLHIFGAALWIGGGIISLLGRGRLVAEGSVVALKWMGFEEFLGKAFFPIAAILTLLSGIGLVLLSEAYGFLDLFVLVGMGAFLVSAIGNAAFAARRDARAVAALVEGEEDVAREHFASTRPFHLVDVAVVVLALIAMVYKWGF